MEQKKSAARGRNNSFMSAGAGHVSYCQKTKRCSDYTVILQREPHDNDGFHTQVEGSCPQDDETVKYTSEGVKKHPHTFHFHKLSNVILQNSHQNTSYEKGYFCSFALLVHHFDPDWYISTVISWIHFLWYPWCHSQVSVERYSWNCCKVTRLKRRGKALYLYFVV